MSPTDSCEPFPSTPKELDSLLQPLEVIKDFEYSDDWNMFTPPFATEEEAYGFLSGSESTVLCSQGEPLYSRNFVQCAGALVRNRRTGLVSLIHQSTWSASASIVLALQRPDDLDVITLQGPSGYMRFETVASEHKQPAEQYYDSFSSIDRTNPLLYPRSDSETNDLKHKFPDYSLIKGISTEEMERMFERCKEDQSVGDTRLLGRIDLPVTREESNRWYLLYRPEENIIWVYESGTRQLFKYAGFPLEE